MDDRVVKTVREMISDRGFEPPEFPDGLETAVVDNALLLYVVKDAKLGINGVKDIETMLKDEQLGICIIVHPNAITSFAKGALGELTGQGYNITIFTTRELTFNVTHHTLVPKHTLMPRGFRKELARQMQCNERRIPLISVADPVSKYYGASLGDVFKIERRDECVHVSPYFRVVSNI